MNNNFNWKFSNRFPLLDFNSCSMSFVGINDSAKEEIFTIKGIDPVILNKLKDKEKLAQYVRQPKELTWNESKYLTVKLTANNGFIQTINQTLYAIKAYELCHYNSDYYIRDYNFGQVSELLGIYPIVTIEGEFIDLSSVFDKITDKARMYLVKLYKEKIFIKFPLPEDIDIEWSKL